MRQGPATVEKAVWVHGEQNRKDLDIIHSGKIIHHDVEDDKDYDCDDDNVDEAPAHQRGN